MIRFFRRLIRDFRKEDGTASIEFVFIVPMLMTIFMASCESGYFMVRHVMLERAVDMTMRELRLGMLGNVTHNQLRTIMCSRTVVIHNCATNLKIELVPISSTTFAMPVVPETCVDRVSNIDPPTGFNQGVGSELMLVRVCARQDAMFPSTGVGLGLDKDPLGGYALVARSAFVNEPS
jgi:Flp pilus assembly protein TadG